MTSGSSITTLKGIWAAKIWIVAPVIVALIVMSLFGEGDYIVPVLAAMWTVSFVIANRTRQRSALGTVKRSTAFHISFWSFWLASLCIAMTLVIISEGEWRRCSPQDANCTTRRE